MLKHILIFLVVVAINTALFIDGLRAYQGKDRKWAYETGCEYPKKFGTFIGSLGVYIGILMYLIAGIFKIHIPQQLAIVLVLIAAFLCLAGAFCSFIIPSFLLPKWYKDERARLRGVSRSKRQR